MVTICEQPTPNTSPPNFTQSCVFQIFVANEEVQTGEKISYGDKVVLIHRASQKFVAKSKSAVEAGFNACLEAVRPMPRFVRGAHYLNEEEAEVDVDEVQAALEPK